MEGHAQIVAVRVALQNMGRSLNADGEKMLADRRAELADALKEFTLPVMRLVQGEGRG